MEFEWDEEKPIGFDEDCEKLFSAMMKAFKSAVAHRICRKKCLKKIITVYFKFFSEEYN